LNTHLGATPNAAHKALVDLQTLGKLKTVITQNVDNLHTVAGNNKVFELHGNASTASWYVIYLLNKQ